MKLLRSFFLIFTLFSGLGNAFSQTLEGYIYDKKKETPLQSATVYIDGTTISTLTNDEGYFKLDSRGNTQSDLVISYIGYFTARIGNPFQYKKIKTFLEEDAINMDEVFIGKGPFSRKRMMKVFKEQFLGTSRAGSSCSILNEDDINLYYDTDTNVLSASSRNPIKIENSYLGYEVNFDLVDFMVKYKVRSLENNYLDKSYFSGTTFYKDISKSKNADKKRMDVFLGSSTHLMQAIANKSWDKEKFKFFVDKFQVNPKEYFKVTDTLGIKKIKIIKEPTIKIEKYTLKVVNFTDSSKKNSVQFEEKKIPFNVLYDGKKQSIVDFLSKEYYVDANGNFFPFYEVLFGGYIGTLKAGDMLPMDYFQSIKGSQ